MGFGIGEILLVLFLAILFFGAKRIPQIARGVGEGIRNFRSSVKEEAENGTLPGSDEDGERRIPGSRDP
jgi:sec-independent protein translocase protein TatA